MSPFRRNRRRAGAAAVEFAIIAPMLALMIVGVWEGTTFLRNWFRIERTAGEVTNVIAQRLRLSRDDMFAIFAAGQKIAGDLDVTGDRGATIVSALGNPTGAGSTVLWQVRGTTNPSYVSRIARTVGAAPRLPPNITVPIGQTLIVTEVFNETAPWRIGAAPLFFGGPGDSPMYSFAVMRPRAAELATAPR
jgi:Flp pilus assembly pilin Flp